MTIIRKIPRTKKPPYKSAVPLDRGNPLNKDIHFAFLGNTISGGILDVAGGLVGTRAGAAADVFVDNKGANFGANDTDAYTFGTFPQVQQSRAFTAFVLAEYSGAATEPFPPVFYMQDADAPSSNGFIMFASTSGNYRPWNCGSGSGATSELAHVRPDRTSENYLQDQEFSMCVVYQGSNPNVSSSFRLYTDGIEEAVTTSSNFASGPTISQIGSSNSHGWRGSIKAVLIWHRELTPGEIKMVHQNPWRLLEPRTQIISIEVALAAATIKRLTLLGVG